MSHADSRCPRCAALIPPRAPWCTLCYADLRPPEEPAPAAVAAAAVASAPTEPVEVTVPAPRAGRHRSVAVVAPAVGDLLVRPRRAAAEAGVGPAAATAGWPCRACGEQVSLDRPACPACGTAFLDLGAETATFELPLVGELLAMSRGRRAALGGGAAVALGLLLLVLATVLGLVV